MKLTRFLRFFLQHSRGMVALMVCAGILSGILSVGVLAVINNYLHQTEGRSSALMYGFAALVVGKIITNGLSQFLLVRFSQDTILDLSLTLCSKIIRTPLRLLEQRGAARILTTLTDDVSSVAWAVQCVPQLVMNSAVVVGCSMYLAWLSWTTFFGVLGVTIVGAVGYKLLHERAFAFIYAAREARSTLFELFRGLTAGVKELQMHRGRREEFLERDVHEAAAELRRSNLAATTHYALADACTQTLFYLLIGLLLFVFPLMVTLPPESLTGYVFALLYLMGPIWSIIGTLPAVARGQVALEQIAELGAALDCAKDSSAQVSPNLSVKGNDSCIVMKQVTFSYEQDGQDGEVFSLGPIDFELHPSELVFIVGGNGSGKSTFVKVLAGLYSPQQGELRLAGTQITESNREWYRENFSVVFADFYLFDKLLGLSTAQIDSSAQHYLKLLQIDHKVSLNNRVFSTVNLSQGQRRRLALVTAYLEDRPFYVFDEWAADQDPQYKEIFYSKLLSDLRTRGKAVVVITHDDRYFHLGDRVLKLEDGKMVGSWSTGANTGRVANLII